MLSECRTFSWHWPLAKNKEMRTNEEWKQIRCNIKKSKSGGIVGVRNMLWVKTKGEGGWERTWSWSQMQLSVSRFWAMVLMDHFHREPTESKSEVTEKRPPSQPLSTPVSAYTHSSEVTQHLYLKPPAWSSSWSSSPLPKFWTCQNVRGMRWTEIPDLSAKGTRMDVKGREGMQRDAKGCKGKLAVSTLRKSENTGRGILLCELLCLFRLRGLTCPPLSSAGYG